ncbi:MAG: thioredoxin family protein [Maribacter sp.]|jgi:thiol-disulfide isomerase/thioredoxin
MATTVLKRMEKPAKEVVQKGISKAMTYQDYRRLVDNLSAESRSTGPEQSEVLTNYTLLNQRRMKRLDKTLKISDASVKKIKDFDKKVTWLVLTESWCGDAAQTMPMMNKVAEHNDNISFKVILRDENLDVMNRFLTNNTMSIPKLVMVEDATGEILRDWGSRPKTATQMVIDYKNEHGTLTPEFKEELQVWYNKDKGQSTLSDLMELLALE